MIEINTFVVGPLETNCYLVYDKAKSAGFLIDPGFFDRRIENAIKEKNLAIKNIINTHGHIDHIGGNKRFGYPVLIHEADKDFLKNPAKNLMYYLAGVASSPLSSAAELLKDNDVIEESGIKFEVIHTPGHTPGGICLKSGDTIFTGDTLFKECVGRTDLPNSDERALFDSIRNRLLIFPDNVRILPGHGPDSTIGHERKHNPFLTEI